MISTPSTFVPSRFRCWNNCQFPGRCWLTPASSYSILRSWSRGSKWHRVRTTKTAVPICAWCWFADDFCSIWLWFTTCSLFPAQSGERELWRLGWPRIFQWAWLRCPILLTSKIYFDLNEISCAPVSIAASSNAFTSSRCCFSSFLLSFCIVTLGFIRSCAAHPFPVSLWSRRCTSGWGFQGPGYICPRSCFLQLRPQQSWHWWRRKFAYECSELPAYSFKSSGLSWRVRSRYKNSLFNYCHISASAVIDSESKIKTSVPFFYLSPTNSVIQIIFCSRLFLA